MRFLRSIALVQVLQRKRKKTKGKPIETIFVSIGWTSEKDGKRDRAGYEPQRNDGVGRIL